MRYIILVALVCFLFACKKENVPFYSEKDGIAFYTSNAVGSDSTAYSFALNSTPKVRDTVYFDMRVVGKKADYARAITVVPGEGTTATLGTDFLLPEVKLPAGQLELKYPIILLKTAAMATQSYTIMADVAVSNDFILGAVGELPRSSSTVLTTTVNRRRVKVSVTDRLIQPIYWTSVQTYFGVYSNVKLRFMIEVLGITDFSSNAIGANGRLNYPLKLRQALLVYESANGPLLDENGVRVTF